MTKEATLQSVQMGDGFQYRKRYEVTCDFCKPAEEHPVMEFQYRKRYEVTCDEVPEKIRESIKKFQYRKRYEVTCDLMLD